ncbi:hypothetical protein QL285_059437 [Trifolium repens]|nr:hypothetical protein QL285_059428 [Trifolium repens]KAK2397913.1 hypothetical protein QL285_059437 [Trifolium repens]
MTIRPPRKYQLILLNLDPLPAHTRPALGHTIKIFRQIPFKDSRSITICLVINTIHWRSYYKIINKLRRLKIITSITPTSISARIQVYRIGQCL